MMTLMMTSTQVVETSVNVTTNSPSLDYTHPNDRTSLSYEIEVHSQTPQFEHLITSTSGKS